jgi:hypothetical protein
LAQVRNQSSLEVVGARNRAPAGPERRSRILWMNDTKLTRIAVFFDGGYFDEVSKYYKFNHTRHSRLSVQGVQSFIRREVATC